jgi:hypothetical protein
VLFGVGCESLGDRALADARFAAEDDHAAATGDRLRERTFEYAKLLGPSGQHFRLRW